jgi:hypothetical protein
MTREDDDEMAQRSSRSDDASGVTLTTWARGQVSNAAVVTCSEPEPYMLEHNAIAVSRSPDAARSVVLAWERILPEDGAVGFLAFGTPPEHRDESGHVEHGADGLAGHAASRIVRGSIPGAVVVALFVTLVVWAVVGWTPALIGAALGGAAFGFIAGAMFSFVRGTGWGAAYRDTFVDDQQTAVMVASIHSDRREPIDRAVEAVQNTDAIELYCVDRTGRESRLR